jgi:hypothetical protein
LQYTTARAGAVINSVAEPSRAAGIKPLKSDMDWER